MADTSYGLKWKFSFTTLIRTWSVEPNEEVITRIARRVLQLGSEDDCTLSFQSAGSLNKCYRVDTTDGSYVFRVALPVDPLKTYHELETMAYLEDMTSLPIPRVQASDSDRDNELHFAWILMDYAPEYELQDAWRKLSWESKELCVRELAQYQAQLYGLRSHSIGSLSRPSSSRRHATPTWEGSVFTLVLMIFSSQLAVLWLGSYLIRSTRRNSTSATPQIGRTTDWRFLLESQPDEAASYGPYVNSHDWLRSRLLRLLAYNDRLIATDDTAEYDEDDREDAETRKTRALELLDILPRLFPPDERGEDIAMVHRDLNDRNILVSSDGDITAILDWENQHTGPSWYACRLPQTLTGWKREKKPRRDKYGSAESLQSLKSFEACDGVSLKYWEDLLEYELTLLRKVWAEEMERLIPGWKEMYEKTKFHRLYEQAITELECNWAPKVDGWFEAYQETGRVPSRDKDGWPQVYEDHLSLGAELDLQFPYSDEEDDDSIDGDDDTDTDNEEARADGDGQYEPNKGQTVDGSNIIFIC